ncbi:MAG: hypothetical protein Kow0056_06670 [Coriobacteriia bacterium]
MTRRTLVSAALLAATAATLAIAIVATLAKAAPSPPFDSNTDCLECHDVALGGPAFTKVDFDVPPVDRQNCWNCHWFSEHYFESLHPAGWDTQACSNCHWGWPSPSSFVMADVRTDFGWFLLPTSPDVDAQTLHSIHVNGSWPKKNLLSPDTCSSCHAPAACSACHGSSVPHGEHTYDAVTGTYVYPPVTYKQAPGTPRAGSTEEPWETAVTWYKAPATCVNAACHARASAATADFVPQCSSCHPERTDAHGYETADHVADVGAAVDGGGKTCASCHDMDLYTEHEKATAASAGGGCSTCHPTPRDTFATWDDTCAACHTEGSPMEPHTGMTAAHTPPSTGEAAVCTECHAAGDLTAIHAGAVSSSDPSNTSCNVCHTTTAYPPTSDCVTCHFTFDGHYDPVLHTSTWDLDANGCVASGCHSTGELWPEHESRGLDCFSCHGSADPAVQGAIASGDTACGACHTGIGETTGHYAMHAASPPLLDSAGDPNYSYYEGSSGGVPTSDCAGCHTSNLIDEHLGVAGSRPARTDSSGTPLSCDSCHGSADLGVQAAIAQGLTACESCHDVHGPMGATHASTFVDSPPYECGNCHSSTLTLVHESVVATPDGRTLTGCELCHAYYSGARGAQIQYAIEVADDTRCSACHDAYHPDFDMLHQAPASQECVDCHETADVRQIHATDPADPSTSCARCHNATVTLPATTDCAGCHDYSPPDPAHYLGTEAIHTADGVESGVSNTGGKACVTCHQLEMKPEHFKASSYFASVPGTYADKCTACHETKVDGLTSWNKDCQACHAVATIHPDSGYAEAHDWDPPFANSASCGEGAGIYCHAGTRAWLGDINAVDDLHSASRPGAGDCTSCHDDNTAVPTESECSQCHATHAPTSTAHDASAGAFPANAECLGCHAGYDAAHMIHSGGCVGCHENTTLTAGGTRYLSGAFGMECVGCHNAGVLGAYHSGADTAHYFADGASCTGAGCHASQSLPEAHEPYLSRYPQYADTCALCHLNEDPARIDWASATADCSSCHTVHADLDVLHQAPDSQECVDCHETADVRQIHATDPADPSTSCGTCHNATVTLPATTDCAGCHDYSPADPAHYDAAAHTAREDAGCGDCHYLEMKPEHFKDSSGPVSCVTCHESKVDGFSAPWDGSCMACHSARHTEQDAKHASSVTECGGSGCHPVGDVSDVHDGTPVSGSSDGGSGTYTPVTLFSDGFESGNLSLWDTTTNWEVRSDQKHSGAYSARQRSTSLCSLGVATDASGVVNLSLSFWLRGSNRTESADWVRVYVTSDGGAHWAQVWGKTLEDRQDYWVEQTVTIPDEYATPDFGFQIRADVSASDEYQYVDDVVLTGDVFTPDPTPPSGGSDGTGCERCHSASKVPATTDCYTCHPTATPGHRESHDASGFIPAGCSGCHFVYLNDEHLALGLSCGTCHDSTDPVVQGAIASGDRDCMTCHPDGHYKRNQQDIEFNPANASAHRVDASLPGMRDTFVVNGNTYTWTRPSASAFLQSGLTYDSMLSCESCHTFGSSPAGPHGSSVSVNIDPNYPNDWKNARLDSNSGIICNKCHNTNYRGMNRVHEKGDHTKSNIYCNSCHVSVPHGWARPRLIGTTSDPAPYMVRSGGIDALRLSNHSYSGWDDSDCYASCAGDHDRPVSPVWPAVVVPPGSTGAVAGVVTDADTGAPVSGAAVSVGAYSAMTDSSGAYSIGGIPEGDHGVTITKAGYESWTGSVSVVGEQTTTLNVTLTPLPAGAGNLALGKQFWATRYEGSNVPGNAGDGSTSTYWWSNEDGRHDDDERLLVDLGSRYRVSKVEIVWDGYYYARRFRVEVSADGDHWSRVYETDWGSSGTSTVTFSARDARYVRIECRETNGQDHGYRIAELRVFE